MKIVQETPINQPEKPTHSLVIYILSKDATVKQLVVKYCTTDCWSYALRFDCINTGELIKRYMYPIIAKDKNAIAIAATIIDQVTGIVVVKFRPVILPEYIKMQSKQPTVNLLS